MGSNTSLLLASRAQLFDFEAPYLEEKLVRLGVAADREQARELFGELKRYFVLSELHPKPGVPMISTRIDRVWHEFILFTAQYAAFCERYAGRFLHHEPGDPSSAANEGDSHADDFATLYEAEFGALPNAWRDDLAVTPNSRLCWSAGLKQLTVTHDGAKAALHETSDEPQLLCRTNLRAKSALDLIAVSQFFHVRELPGLRSNAEAVELVQPLVRFGVLNLAL